MKDLEENQDYIIELLHEIIDISRNKGPMISPNLMNESTWIPPDRPGISNSLPIIHSHRIYDKKNILCLFLRWFWFLHVLLVH